MKQFFVCLTFIFVFSVATFAQINKISPCPTISLVGPATFTIVGETMTFTVSIDNENSYKYKWTVSDGTVIEGLGTRVIKVITTPEEAEKEITVTVELNGLPPNCVNTASQKAFVTRGNFDPVIADEYGKLSDKDEKARLENIASQLKQNKDFKAYFLVYLPEKNQPETAKKQVSKIKSFLINNQKISEERIVIFINQADSFWTRIYLVPDGAIFPNPEL